MHRIGRNVGVRSDFRVCACMKGGRLGWKELCHAKAGCNAPSVTPGRWTRPCDRASRIVQYRTLSSTSEQYLNSLEGSSVRPGMGSNPPCRQRVCRANLITMAAKGQHRLNADLVDPTNQIVPDV